MLAAVAATFATALGNGAVWDDAPQTTKNPYVQSLGGLRRIFSTDTWSASALEEPGPFYRPVAMASYLANRLVGGNSAASYHAGNLLLHALNALLLGLVLARSRPGRRGVAILVPALLFAVAPLNAEAVVYISARMDLLGTTFVLAALAVNAGAGARARGAAVLLVATALFCKESFVVAPVLLYLHDALVLRRPPRPEAPKYAGMAAAVAAMFVARRLVGVPSASLAASTGVAALVRGYAFLLTTFARLLVYPAYLDPFRTYAPAAGLVVAAVVAAGVALGVAAAVALRRRSDDGGVREAVFALAWLAVALAPAALAGANLDIVGERYAYFPFLGVFFALAPLLDGAWPRARAFASVAAALVVAVVVAYAWRAHARVRDWATETTLYEASLCDDPDNAYALYGLGEGEALAGRYADATTLLTRSLEKNPDGARAWTALCYVHLNQGQAAVAAGECERSIAIQPANPRAWINLAGARVNQRQWASGLDAATRATTMKPRSAEAHYLRAACLANLGSLTEARQELGLTLEIEPEHPGANHLLRQFRARGIQ